MNINGRDITAADLLNRLDLLHSTWYNVMYNYLTEDSTFLKDMPGTNYKKRQLIDELVEYFVQTEEYEKCAKLIKFKRW